VWFIGGAGARWEQEKSASLEMSYRKKGGEFKRGGSQLDGQVFSIEGDGFKKNPSAQRVWKEMSGLEGDRSTTVRKMEKPASHICHA